MKTHLHHDDTEFPQTAQSLISLVSFDPKAGAYIVDANLAEALLGVKLNSIFQKQTNYPTAPNTNNPQFNNQQIPDVENSLAVKNKSERLAKEATQRREEFLSNNHKEFTSLGRKGARLLRDLSVAGHKQYAAQQEVSRIIGKPWTEIQYAVHHHNKKLNSRYESLRSRLIIRLRMEEGWKIKDIAKRLNVHPKTVSSWIKNIQNKKRSS